MVRPGCNPRSGPMTWCPSESPWLRAVLIIGVLVAVITEGLSALKMIAPFSVAVCWALTLAAVVVVHRRRMSQLVPAAGPAISIEGGRIPWTLIAIFLAATLIIGLASAPNNWDGLSYHLPRVERWVDQGHLGLWATPVDRQLFMAPWAGYAILHLRLLTGGDALAFLPSWLAYLGCILLTVKLVHSLGGTARQSVLGGLLMATAPVAVLHASSVQTDLLTAFWVLCVAGLAIEAWRREGRAADWRHALCLIMAAGLAGATKFTALFAVTPWLGLYALSLVRGGGMRRLATPLAMGLVAGLVLHGPALLRNFELFGRITGPAYAGPVHLFQPFAPNGALANIVANMVMHIGTPWAELNANLARGLLWLTREVFRADPSEVFTYWGEFYPTGFSSHESGAGLPVLLGSAVIAAVALFLRRNAEFRTRVLPFLIAGGAAFLLHAALVRWQPFGARLQLASLVWVPFAIPLLCSHRRVQALLGGIATALALPALLFGSPRSLLGERSVLATNRSEQLAVERPGYFQVVEWTVLMAGLSNCRELGILTSYDFPEYYLTALVRREELPLRWRYIGDVGESTGLGHGPGTEGLCMILVAEPVAGTEPPGLRGRFRVVWAEPPFEVLEYLGEPGG